VVYLLPLKSLTRQSGHTNEAACSCAAWLGLRRLLSRHVSATVGSLAVPLMGGIHTYGYHSACSSLPLTLMRARPVTVPVSWLYSCMQGDMHGMESSGVPGEAVSSASAQLTLRIKPAHDQAP